MVLRVETPLVALNHLLLLLLVWINWSEREVHLVQHHLQHLQIPHWSRRKMQLEIPLLFQLAILIVALVKLLRQLDSPGVACYRRRHLDYQTHTALVAMHNLSIIKLNKVP